MDTSSDDPRHELDHLRVETQTDLQRLWELLMRPLGFRATSLWVTFIGEDRRPTRFLLEVTEHPDVPHPDQVAGLYDVLTDVLRVEEPGCTAAFLITRPGRGGLTSLDRLFGSRLLAGARLAGVPIEPIHVANDVTVLALAPDDLAA
jgi:hypothetical protein